MSSPDLAFAGSSFLYKFFFMCANPHLRKTLCFCPHYLRGWTAEEAHCPNIQKTPKNFQPIFIHLQHKLISPVPILSLFSWFFSLLAFFPNLFIVQNCISSLCYFSLCGDPNTTTAKPMLSVVLSCFLGQTKFTESAKPGLVFHSTYRCEQH